MSADGGGGAASGPSVRGAIIRFAVAGLVAMAALGVVGGIVLNRLAEDEVIDDARRLATLAGRRVVEPSFTDARRPSRTSTWSCRSRSSPRMSCA